MASCNNVEIDAEKEIFKAICFILRADETRYGDLLEELWKGVYRGRDEYPNTVSDAYELLLWTSQQIGYSQRRTGQPSHRAQTSGKSEGFIFTQQGGRGRHGAERGNENNQEEVAGRNKILHRGVR